jgi:hypothetical protein
MAASFALPSSWSLLANRATAGARVTRSGGVAVSMSCSIARASAGVAVAWTRAGRDAVDGGRSPADGLLEVPLDDAGPAE